MTTKELILSNKNKIQYKLSDFLESFESGQYSVDFCYQIAAGRGFKKDQLMLTIYKTGEYGVNINFNVDTLKVERLYTQGKYNKEYTKEITNIALWLFIFHLETIIKDCINELTQANNKKNTTETAQEQSQQTVNQSIPVVNNNTANTYTAYNRSFSSYTEAEAYCIDSDFDPSYITTEQPSTASQHALKLDLQLFSTNVVQEEAKPFKRPYAEYKDGVHKFGIGKHLDLVFTIETTRNDPNYDEINYSNVYKYEFNNLEKLLERFNLYQEQGFHNIQFFVDVRYKGNPVIETSTSGNMEFIVNDSRMKEAKEIEKENKHLKEELEQYKDFITKYKVEKTFNKYIEEKQCRLTNK